MIDLKAFRQDPEGFRIAILRRLDPALPEALDRLGELEREWRRVGAAGGGGKTERKKATPKGVPSNRRMT